MRSFLEQGLCTLVALALWEAIGRSGLVAAGVLPPFSAVAPVMLELAGSAEFLREAQVTLVEVLAAFAIAAPLGLACGALLGESRRWGAIFNPVIELVLAVPQSVFLPLFMLALGTGYAQKIVFGVTHAFFIITVNTVAAVRSVPRSWVALARVSGARRGQIYRRIYLPAMLPLVLAGLRLGLIFDVTGVLLAEMFASRHGVGRLIFGWGENDQIPQLIAGILLVAAVTVILNGLLRLWEARAGAWRSAGRPA